MLHILNFEELNSALAQLSGVVDKYERKDTGFADAARAWLLKIETILQNNRLTTASIVAGFRGQVVACRRGANSDIATARGRISARTARDGAIVRILKQASESVMKSLDEDRARIEESQRIGLQIVTMARAKGIIDSSISGLKGISSVWESLSNDVEIASGIVRMISLIGCSDSLITLDRSLAVK